MLRTAKQLASDLEISTKNLYIIAKKNKIGRKLPKTNVWIFNDNASIRMKNIINPQVKEIGGGHVWTAKELANIFKISMRQIYTTAKNYKIGRKFGKFWLFEDEEAIQIEERNNKKGRPIKESY